MDIDIYQQCPCHAEKKIKFCCGKSVVSDLDDALSKSKAGQTSSALEQLQRTIAKTGPKDCLVTIQTRLLLQNGEIEKAKESNALFQKNNPEHPSGFHHLALILAQEGDAPAAVEALQDTMDSIVGNSIPTTYAQAFRDVGRLLLQKDDLYAARAHLRYADLLKTDQDTKQILLSTFQRHPSICGKTELMPEPCPEGVEWEKKYKNVLRAIDRGQFRKSLKMARKADASFPGVNVIKRAIAILYSMLGRKSDAIEAWQELADLAPANTWEQINALSIRYFLSKGDERQADVIRHTYEIEDFARLKEVAASSKQFSPAKRPDEDPFQEGNPPVVGYYLLSKPKLQVKGDDYTLDDVPFTEGEVLLYAKQTDRPARLEYVVPKVDTYNQSVKTLKGILGDLCGEPKVAKIDSTPELDVVLSWDWVLPEETSFEKHAGLMKQQIRNRLLDKWMDYPFVVLGNRSAREAIKDEQMRPVIQTMLTEMEHDSQIGMYPEEVLQEMRTELGVEQLPPLEDADPDIGSMFSLTRANLDFSKIADTKLFQAHEFGMMVRCTPIIKRTCLELLKRAQKSENIQSERVYSVLASISNDTDEVLDYLSKARNEAKSAGRSIGTLLVQEFEFRLSRGLNENLKELIRTIQTRHLDEPEVEYRLTEVLMRYGLYDPSLAEGETPVPPPSSRQKLQTAGSAESKTSAESPLWIPE